MTAKKRRDRQLKDYFHFLHHYVAEPKVTGAIAPSSQALAKMITGWVDLENAEVVVEFGPGTGVFTGMIKQKIPPDTIFLAIEINPSFVSMLQKKHPDVNIYHDCIENTRQYLESHGATHCDCIISGLPWAAFDDELQERLLDAVYDVLKPGGQFVTFAYLQGVVLKNGRRFRKKIFQRFDHVSTSPIVWRNLPPAFVYQATK